MTGPSSLLSYLLLLAVLLAGCAKSGHEPAAGPELVAIASEEVTVHQTWNAGSWVNARRSVTTRDAEGRPSLRTEARYHGVGWTVEERTYLSYTVVGNQDTLLAGSRQEQRTREGWRNTDSTRHVYDETGRRIQTEVLAWMWPAARWVPARRIVYDYDEVDYDKDGYDEEGLERSRLTLRPYYGADGEQVTLASASDVGWHHQELVTFAYNAAGQCSTEVLARWRDEQWQPHERRHYVWENGRLATETTDNWHDGIWVPERMRSISYDAEGRAAETLYRAVGATASEGGKPLTRAVVTYR